MAPPPPSTISYAPLHGGPVVRPPQTIKGEPPFLNYILPPTPNAVNISLLVAYVVVVLALAYGTYVAAQYDAWMFCLFYYAVLVGFLIGINATDADCRGRQMLPT